MIRLQWTPEGQEIYKRWEETRDVYYMRKNFERLMTIRPWTKRLYVRRFGEPEEKPPVYNLTTSVSVRLDASRGFKERQKALDKAKEQSVEEEGDYEDEDEGNSGFSTLDKTLLAVDLSLIHI